MGILKDGWSPALTITKVLLAVRSLLINPDPCKFFYSLLEYYTFVPLSKILLVNARELRKNISILNLSTIYDLFSELSINY